MLFDFMCSACLRNLFLEYARIIKIEDPCSPEVMPDQTCVQEIGLAYLCGAWAGVDGEAENLGEEAGNPDFWAIAQNIAREAVICQVPLAKL